MGGHTRAMPEDNARQPRCRETQPMLAAGIPWQHAHPLPNFASRSVDGGGSGVVAWYWLAEPRSHLDGCESGAFPRPVQQRG